MGAAEVVKIGRYSLGDAYPGVKPFSFDESDRFFGRDAEKMDLKHLVLANSTVLLYGESGTGKSSLLQAGLLPLLTPGEWALCRVSGALPSGILPEAVANIHTFSALYSISGYTDDVSALTTASLCDWFGDKPTRFLIFDQFEELLTAYPERWQDRIAFLRQLATLLDRRRDIRTLFVLRQEQLGEIERFEDELPDGFRARFQLQRLRPRETMLAILGPAKLAGVDTEQDEVQVAAREIVEQLQMVPVEVGGTSRKVLGEFIEPLHLQIVCRQLVLTGFKASAEAKKLRDVDTALMDYYNRTMAEVSAASGSSARRLRTFIEQHLITSTKTRGLVHQGSRAMHGIPNEALTELARKSIVRSEKRGGATWYELTHDRLINPILEANEQWRKASRRWRILPLAILGLAILIVAGVLEIRRFTAMARKNAADSPLVKEYEMVLRSDQPVDVLVVLKTGNPEAKSKILNIAVQKPIEVIKALNDALQSALDSHDTRALSILKNTKWEIIRTPALSEARRNSPELNSLICTSTVIVIGESGSAENMAADLQQRWKGRFPDARLIAPPHNLAFRPKVIGPELTLFVPDIALSCEQGQRIARTYMLEDRRSAPLITRLEGCGGMCPAPRLTAEEEPEVIALAPASIGASYSGRDQIRRESPGAVVRQVGGFLPPGLSLQRDGRIVGRPTKARPTPYEFLIKIMSIGEEPKYVKYSILVKDLTKKGKTDSSGGRSTKESKSKK